jgi:hypothetical protein
MEEEKLEIINVEELNKERKNCNVRAVVQGVGVGIELLCAALRIYELFFEGKIASGIFGFLFAYWTVDFAKDMNKTLTKVNECEEKLRHHEQESYKVVNTGVLEDNAKKERGKAILFGAIGGLISLASIYGLHAANENSNLLAAFGPFVPAGFAGYLYKKMCHSIKTAESLENDVRLIKG